MEVKSNALVKILVPTVLVIGGFIGIKSCSSTEGAAPSATSNHVLATLSPEELQALGVGGDTPEDTLRTLIGSLNKVRAEQKKLSQQNTDILKENDQQSLLAQIDLLTERLNSAPLPAQDSQMPLGLGLAGNQYAANPVRGQDEFIWVNPADEKPTALQAMGHGQSTPQYQRQQDQLSDIKLRMRELIGDYKSR
ncbi:hypothetical protein ABLB69_19505 [Xenorhabdus khoisanae]|uniref:hypothetical protein n=1 Tax=Xenorhabdus khoisanae TaxID=880157 RepID=UPI0032B7777A